MKEKLKYISNALFYGGILVSVFGFYKVWEVRSKLPEGVCPIDDNREILIFGIILLVTSVIVDFIDDRLKKKIK